MQFLIKADTPDAFRMELVAELERQEAALRDESLALGGTVRMARYYAGRLSQINATIRLLREIEIRSED